MVFHTVVSTPSCMANSLNSALGRVVLRRRERLGLSQEKFAYGAGIDRRYMSDIERGVTNVSLEMVERLATGLDITASRLIADAERERGET